MKKKKGFTLVELLAVIVILAVILIIAVPRISEVINNSKKASFEATAKTIASQAEKKYMENEVLGNTGSFECSDVVKINTSDYASCTITFDTNGNATVTLNGSGKFAGLTIKNATKNSATATELTAANSKYFSYYEFEKNVEVIDQSKCVAYFKNIFGSDDSATTLCNGGVKDGLTLTEAITNGYIPASDYETAGLKVTNGSNVVITGYNTEGGLDVVIPSIIDGKTVVAIAIGAFKDKEIKSVVIPNSVTNIGDTAFSGNQLTSIVIPSSVTYIGHMAFAYNQINEITFPTTAITIYDRTFYGNPITNSGTYTYPDNVTVIMPAPN